MFIWRILELALVASVALFIISQIILPPFINKRFFWIFRKKERKLNGFVVNADMFMKVKKHYRIALYVDIHKLIMK